METAKVTLLDCIRRIPSLIGKVLSVQDDMFADFERFYREHADEINEIVLIGSGTSNTVSITARPFMERVSGLVVRTSYPNDCEGEGRVFNPHALYVFISQTGSSGVVCGVMKKLASKGFYCVSLTEGPETILAGSSPCHITMNCGKEEYGMRTIGYTISVLDLMLLAIRIGRIRGKLTKEEAETYTADAAKVPESHAKIISMAEGWFEQNKRRIMRSDCIIFTGADECYGLSLEGAVKFWEMPQVISIGYELEEGMHGPNYGYTGRHCVIILNDGGRQSEKALSLARYMKNELHNGYVIGAETADDEDLKIAFASTHFRVLEMSAAVQTMAYFLTIDGGRDLTKPTDHSKMYSYFSTHFGW